MSRSWYTDRLTPHDVHRHELKKTLVRAKTKFQKAILAETYSFGRCLILDGEIQSAGLDEFMYHECLVHPAMALHPSPRRILVLGGGEGATLREILRHGGVEQVTMVDIDRDVVRFCKRYLSGWHRGAFADRKTRLVIGDARKYILETKEQFDIIISDLPTPACPVGRPSEGGPIRKLYSRDFYRHVRGRLKPGGLFVVQSGSGNLIQIKFHAAVCRTAAKVFNVVRPYYAFVPSFNVPWAFLIASRKADPRHLSAVQVDRRLGPMKKALRFYDGETHEGLFRIPKYLRMRSA